MTGIIISKSYAIVTRWSHLPSSSNQKNYYPDGATLLHPEHLGEMRVCFDFRSDTVRTLLLVRSLEYPTSASVDDYAFLRVGGVAEANAYPTIRRVLLAMIGDLDYTIEAQPPRHFCRCGEILISQRQCVEAEGRRSHRYKVWERTMRFWCDTR